jgi:hydrogenase/urease accessory protein HupE
MLTTLIAHAGHAGDHGWLAGAAEPLLSVDHFLAALFILVMVTLAIAAAARRGPVRQDATRTREG